MPSDLKDLTVIVWDTGSYVDVAQRLARDFGTVKYFAPWVSGFPKSVGLTVGTGLDDIERVEYFWDEVDGADLIVFCDVYAQDMEVYLRKQGKPVWGMGRSADLELERWDTRQLQKELGMPVPETRRFIGMDALLKHLKTVENKYVKVSKFRGDMETRRHEKFWLSKNFFEDLDATLGEQADEEEFLVEGEIEGTEVGFDAWTVDGQYPSMAMYGYEIKDMGYVGHVVPYANLPKGILFTNSKLSPIFKKNKSRGFYSNEIRIDKKRVPYLIDPTIRCPSPPIEGEMEMYSNLGEIIWRGAQGELVVPKPVGKYCTIAMMYSDDAGEKWVPIEIPEEDRQWVKIKNVCKKGDHYYSVPYNQGHTEIGAVVGIGNTLQESIDKVKKVAEKVHAPAIEIHCESIDKALDVIKEGKKVGIEF